MFQASTAKQMQYDMHLRAWSWFDTFLRHDREPFVKFIQGLREAKEARVSLDLVRSVAKDWDEELPANSAVTYERRGDFLHLS